MKYIVLIICAAAGTYYYFNPDQSPLSTYAPPSPSSEDEAAAETTSDAPLATSAVEVKTKKVDEDLLETPPESDRMVQIQGKWYRYRQDNTYLINGVPTLFIPQKAPEKQLIKTKIVARTADPQYRPENDEPVRQEDDGTPPDRAASAVVATPKGSPSSEKLIRMAQENPMKVYTPDGFKTLREGVEAVKKAPAHRAKAVEAASRGE